MAAQSEIVGGWKVSRGEARAQGRLSAHQLRLAGHDPLAGLKRSAEGTPVAPLAAKLADAVRRAGEDNVLQTNLALSQRGEGGSVVLTGTRFQARSGARVMVPADGRITVAWPGKAVVFRAARYD
jgi:hypothetical protein